MRTLLIVSLSVVMQVVPVLAAETVRTPVTQMRPLLARAAEQGAAYGVLVGDGARYAAQRFQSTAPIEIDVQVLHPLPQPGCSRLKVTTRQRGVLENDRREDKEFDYQISFCRDGSFPEKK